MTVTLADLTAPLTVEEAQTALYAAMAARGLTATSWKPGAIARTIVYAVALLVAALSLLISLVAEGGFLTLAKEDWLTLLARYNFAVERNPGTQATFLQRFDNAGGGVYSGGAGDLVVSSSVNGKSYRSTGAWSIGALATDVLIEVEAVEVGTGSNAAPGDVDTMVSVLTGVTTTNPNAVVAEDVEEDPALELRCEEKLGSLSPNGPRDAYAYFARTARTTDGSPTGVTRVRVVADGFGNVDVYLADADGGIAGSVGDLTTPLGAADDAIQRNAVPECVTETTHAASAHSVAVTYEYWLDDTTGQTDGQIEAAVAAALAAFMAARPIGGDQIVGESTGRVYKSAIEGAIAATFPGSTIRVSVTLPAADVDVTATQVPTLGAVSGTVHQEAEGGL